MHEFTTLDETISYIVKDYSKITSYDKTIKDKGGGKRGRR